MDNRPVFRAHPWHGMTPGKNPPEVITAFIEMVPTDTVKYELDKQSGHLMVDRPQKYSSMCPALYGFIPQTYCDKKVAEAAMTATGKTGIKGDGDPLDILVITERNINQGGVVVSTRPIGGLRLFDGEEADDKILAILVDDPVYNEINDISEVPSSLLERIRHYFLTYKEMPAEYTDQKRTVEITNVYGREESYAVIKASFEDYQAYYSSWLR